MRPLSDDSWQSLRPTRLSRKVPEGRGKCKIRKNLFKMSSTLDNTMVYKRFMDSHRNKPAYRHILLYQHFCNQIWQKIIRKAVDCNLVTRQFGDMAGEVSTDCRETMACVTQFVCTINEA